MSATNYNETNMSQTFTFRYQAFPLETAPSVSIYFDLVG